MVGEYGHAKDQQYDEKEKACLDYCVDDVVKSVDIVVVQQHTPDWLLVHSLLFLEIVHLESKHISAYVGVYGVMLDQKGT